MSRDPRRLAGSGEPLVLIHGLGHSRRAWLPVLDALESRHEVLSLDLPGFGEAPPLPSGIAPTVPALTDFVEREMDAAGFDSAHIAGNSMGGWIALELARRGRARTVVAISPAGGGSPRERAYSRYAMKAFRAVTRVVSHVAEAVAIGGPTRTVFFGMFFARPNRLPREDAAYTLRAYARGPAFPAACDWLFTNQAQGLEEIACPVTIAWGTRDLILFPRQARHFLAGLPDARLVTLDGLGHVPMSDDPARLAEVILERTSGVAPRPAAVNPPRTAPAQPSARG